MPEETDEPKKPGRPPKTEVEEAVAAAICTNLEIGMPLGLAAECEDVDRATVYRWMEKFDSFKRRVTRARAQGAKMLQKLSLTGEKGSADARWHLERRFRDDYSPPREEKSTAEVKVTIEGGLPKFPQ